MPGGVVRVVHRDLNAVARGVGVFFEGEAVVLVQDRFAELAAVRFGDFDFPGVRGSIGLR